MKDVIKKIPIPICGVMLGAAALGNLKFTSELFRRNPLCVWSVRSISADPGTSEANYVSGSCEGRYEESDHGKRIRNISDGTYDLKYLCKTIYRTGGLLYLAVCDRITYRADHLFYGEICI